MNRNFERGGSRKTGTRRLRKFWKVCAWGLSISMILGTGNIGSYIVTADDGEVQVTEIPAETSEPETETSEEPVFSVSPESTPSPEAAAYAVTEMTPAPSESTQPSESPAWTAAPEPSAISTVIPETAAPEPSAASTVLPETAEPVSSPVATEAPASMPEMSFEQKEETTGITVSVKAEAGTFPKGTTMELSPVKDQSILEDAKQASELQNPSAVAVDITFRDPEGTIIEPQKQIRVTMTSDVIRQAESVDVVHVPDQTEEASTAVVDQVPDQNLPEEEKPAEDQVVFDADQFSVYAIVYTVDFTFSGYTYSMEGGSSILLSSLASQLGLHDSEHDKDFNINEVAGVSFSDPSLVSIEQRDNDYMLTSLQPFTSDETLTIAMNDGSKYLVDVKDEQDEQEVNLGDYITSVVTYKKNNDKWQETSSIQDGDYIKFQLNFTVNGGILSRGQKLTYTMDKHITIDQKTSGPLFQETNEVGTVSVDTDGKVTISLNNSFDATKAFEGNVQFEGIVNNSDSKEPVKVYFGSNASITIQPKSVPNPYDLTVNKTGSYQTDTNGNHYIRYEVTLSSTNGTGGPFTFIDSMSAAGIDVPQFATDKVWVYKNGTSNSVDVSPFINNEKKLEIDKLPELSANENYHVIYEVPVNGKITSSDGSSSVTNNCNAWNDHFNVWGNTTTTIHEPIIKKTGTYDSQSRKLKWTITVNNPDEIDLGGSELKDMLSIDGSSSTAVSPLSFTMKDLNGVTVVEGTFDNNGSYRFPNGSGSKQYTITYETDAPSGKEGTQSKVNNTAEFTENGKTYTGTSGDITVDHGNYNVQKWFSQVSSKSEAGEQLSWTAKIDLPDGQLDLNKLKFTDSMTASHGTEMLQGKHYITPALLKNNLKLRVDDTAQKYNIYLEAGTDFKVFDQNENDITNSTEETKLDGFQIHFLDSALSKIKGQNSISLWYDTLTDESEQPAGATWTFKNQAVIPPDHKSEASYDYKKPDGGLVKQVRNPDDKNSSYSSDAPEIEYTGKDITLNYRVMIRLDKNASGNQTIIDTLPAGMTFKSFEEADYFENENYHPNKIWSNGHQINLAELAKVSKVEKQADETTKVTFTLSAGYERNDKDLYIIAFYYTATINDDAQFWGDLHNTEKEYTNQVTWGNLKSDVTAKVKHPIKNLDKVAQLSDVEGTNGQIKKAAYFLTVNPLGSDLVPTKDTITLKDQLSCDNSNVQMQFKPSSLKVFAYDGSKQNHCGDEMNQNRYGFSYDEQKHSLELKLPDETPCVVYYEYYASVPAINSAKLSNSASLSGIANSSSDNTLTLSESGISGSVSRDELTIYKVDSENYRIKLQGVTFDLFQYQFENNTAVWTKIKDSLTTDQDGKIYLKRIEDHLKQDCLYKLIETGVGKNTTYQRDKDKAYYFIWASKDNDQQIWNNIGGDDKSRPKQEEVYFIRHSGTIYVPNESTGITINKVWLNADNSDDNNHPGETTVTLYGQARQPGGVKVTVILKDPNGVIKENEVVHIKSGTSVSLKVATADWGQTFTVEDEGKGQVSTQTFSGGDDHQLELGSPTVDTTYTVVAGWGKFEIKDIYYTPTDEYRESDGEKYERSFTLNHENNFSKTVDDLPLRDDKGNLYYYWVVETPVKGYITSYSDNNGKIQKGTITVTNTRESVPEQQLEFTKIWRDGNWNIKWPSQTSINVSLHRELRNGQDRLPDEVVAVYELSANSVKTSENAPECRSTGKNGTYSYLISGLPLTGTAIKDGKTFNGTWHYYITEEKVSGYLDPKYRSYQADGTISEMELSYAENGQVIVNQKDTSFVLPDTGGRGTHPLTGTGLMFLILAGAFLVARKLLIIRSAGEGGGSI
ncbi:MAG: Cna B-type domain-containing protein [Anaerolactibacter massiliensis]|nr:Cna B-type domain-containing protein [Anaerolactibacter massiliensis]